MGRERGEPMDWMPVIVALIGDISSVVAVISTDTAGNTVYNRYKYNGSAWAFVPYRPNYDELIARIEAREEDAG